MTDLILGAKVIIQDNYPDICIANQTGKIIDTTLQQSMYGIEFDKHIKGHNCRGQGKPGHCWWVPKRYVKPIDNNKEKLRINMIKAVL
jgi:hypothetical protein